MASPFQSGALRRPSHAIRARPAPAVTFFLTLFTFATLDLHARPTPSSNLWHNQADLVDHRSWHPSHSPSLLPDGHSPPPTPASGRSHAACSPLTPLSSPCAQGRSDSVRTSTQNLPRRSSVSTSDYQARHARRRCGPTRSAIEMRSRRSASASGLSRPRRSPGRIVTGEDVISG